MSYVMTYTSLIDSVERWTWRPSDTDFADELPRMVDTTERKISRAIKTLLTRQNVSGSFVTGQGLIQKPTRLIEAISFRFLDNNPSSTTYNQSIELKKRTYEYIRKVYPNVTTSGKPTYYCDYDINNHLLGPDSDSTYPYEMTYYERPQPLGDDNSTNYLTQFCPDLMLYGLLLEASPFLVDARYEEWKENYNDRLRDLGIEDDDRKIPESQKLKGSRK